MKLLSKQGQLSEAEVEVRLFPQPSQHMIKFYTSSELFFFSAKQEIESALTPFKALFPKRTASKGEELLLIKLPSGALAVEFEGELLGTVQEKGVGRMLLMGYFLEGGKEISPIVRSVVFSPEGGFRFTSFLTLRLLLFSNN